MNGLSAHADRREMVAFLDRARPQGPIFLVHGEEKQAVSFENLLEDEHGFPDVRIPEYKDEFRL